MTPPRLLHVFATFDAGGPQVRTARLLAHAGTDFEHVVVAMDGRYGCRERVDPSLPVRYLPPPRGLGPWTALGLLALIRREQPRLVLSYNWGAIDTVLACRLAGDVPLLHHEDGFGPEEIRRRKRRRSLARRALLDTATRVVVPSNVLAEIAEREWGVPGSKLLCVPNGIDTEYFVPGDRSAARRVLALPEDPLLIGAVGHLRAEKDHQNLLAAFARLAGDPHLLLVGDGPEREGLERRAAELGCRERVHFAGFLHDPRAAYRAMDVYTLPSRTEQMPVGLLEAMACGIAIAATDVGDVRRMLPAPLQPYVVAAGAPEALAAAIARLASDSSLRDALGRTAREHVLLTYRESDMCLSHVELWRRFA